ncbi:MAG: hypothetical protein WCJ57_02420 [Candidatus Falkowbacteria bacterium]
MKKAFLILAVFSLIFSFGGISLAQVQDQDRELITTQIQERSQLAKPVKLDQDDKAKTNLEKIASPAEISFFNKIQKIGTALWGVRKNNNSIKPEDKNLADNVSAKLEKISSPAEISFFNKIQKIGTALWGIRKDDAKKKVVSPAYVTPAAAQCVKSAIDKKDSALKTSTSNHSQKVLSAIDVRGTCQKVALEKTTAKEQLEANKVCVNTFLKEVKTVNEVMSKEKNEAKKTYLVDLKACSASQAGNISSSTEIVVEDGGDVIEEIK